MALVSVMPEGPKKMLKIEALKAARLFAEKKAEEAEDLREEEAAAYEVVAEAAMKETSHS